MMLPAVTLTLGQFSFWDFAIAVKATLFSKTLQNIFFLNDHCNGNAHCVIFRQCIS